HDHDPKAVVEVDVLVTVDVPDPASLAAVHEDGLGRGILKGRGDAARKGFASLGPELVGARPGLAETVFLGRDQVGNPAGGDLAGLRRRHRQYLPKDPP